ncbi:MAG TPA: hypothetical protein VMN36_06365 [Verrucomicrobiales bacterium]|nr:hypothetical protein [Verrucomicrobiales bacterium]
MNPRTLIEWSLCLGAILHFSILLASVQVPRALDWKSALAPLPKLLRQLFWVYGAFIVGIIIAFGLLSLLLAPQLARGGATSLALIILIAVFWSARLGVQFFVFDVRQHLTRPLYRIGYRLLTGNLVALVLVYGGTALWLATR